MRIIDLTEETKPLYFQCLEDWSDEVKEAGDHKALWYEKHKPKGLVVKLAADERGQVGGMIQALPIEHAPSAEGQGAYLVLYIWVHGHAKGRGNFQKRGMGKALLRAAEEDARARGATAMVAWGMALPVFMRASWFKKQGYRPVDRMGMLVLLWKPFSENAVAPRWIRPKKKPQAVPGKVCVSVFLNGWCPAMNMTFERAKRAAAEFGDKVTFEAYDTLDPRIHSEWGMADGLFIDGKQVRTGPPPSFKKIKKRIAARAKRIR